MRLIDADDLLAKVQENVPGFMDSGSTIAKAFIMAMINTKSVTPTIDAVPVIRCKDCKYGDSAKNCKGETMIKCALLYEEWLKEPDWFCADGMQK